MNSPARRCLTATLPFLMACHTFFIGDRPADTGTGTTDFGKTTTDPTSPSTSTSVTLAETDGGSEGNHTHAGTDNLTGGPGNTSEDSDSPSSTSSGSSETGQSSSTTVNSTAGAETCSEREPQCDPGRAPPELCSGYPECKWIQHCNDGEINETTKECNKAISPPPCEDCAAQWCGDGTVDIGEECDPLTDELCSEACEILCGNGIIDDGEACDPGTEGQAEGFCSQKCQRIGLFAFVTHDKFQGNLGGVPGADLLCRYAALDLHNDDVLAAANYHAWISDWYGPKTWISPKSAGRMNSCDRPYYSTDGKSLISPDFQALLNQGPLTAIARDEFRNLATGEVWTNTRPSGTVWSETAHCQHWAHNWDTLLAQDTGRIGTITTGPSWTNDGTNQKCNIEAHLYCFEQAPDPCPPQMP